MLCCGWWEEKDCLLQEKVKFALSEVVSQYAPLSLLILGLQVCVAVGPGESSGALRVIRDCTSTGANGPLFFLLGCTSIYFSGSTVLCTLSPSFSINFDSRRSRNAPRFRGTCQSLESFNKGCLHSLPVRNRHILCCAPCTVGAVGVSAPCRQLINYCTVEGGLWTDVFSPSSASGVGRAGVFGQCFSEDVGGAIARVSRDLDPLCCLIYHCVGT